MKTVKPKDSRLKRELYEELLEMLLMAHASMQIKKSREFIQQGGVFGFPAALLLFAAADSMGSYVFPGRARRHFDILNHHDYYNLGLSPNNLDLIYKRFRCLITHHGVLGPNCVLNVGKRGQKVFEIKPPQIFLRLLPLFNRSIIALKNFQQNGPSDEVLQGVIKGALENKTPIFIPKTKWSQIR